MNVGIPIQDLPPQGGYAPINYKRVPAKTYFKGWHFFAGLIAAKLVGFYFYRQYRLKSLYVEIENRSSRFALTPMMVAERDRGMLKQLRFNRDEEERLMKDVPDWEVGKYYDEPLYKTVDPDHWFDPHGFEYFQHSDMDKYIDRIHFKWFHF